MASVQKLNDVSVADSLIICIGRQEPDVLLRLVANLTKAEVDDPYRCHTVNDDAGTTASVLHV